MLTPIPARTEHRFDRQLGLPGRGPAEQERLRAATVVVAGIGGVGGTCATYLAAAGVGRLVLVHPGDLELPDRNRQTLMRPGDLGEALGPLTAFAIVWLILLYLYRKGTFVRV